MKDLSILIETYGLTAYFRSILNITYSFEMINFLLKISNISIGELENRWDSFDQVFGKKYGNKISALSFATIIEARGILLNNILSSREKDEDL